MDQFHDPSLRKLWSLVKDRPAVQSLIKTAAIEDGSEVDALPNSAFADQDNRLYPIHTPEHAVMSSLYMEKQASVRDEVKHAVKVALDLYDITVPAPPQVKVASEPSYYLLEDERMYPCDTPEQVKIASDYLYQHHKSMPLETRTEFATSLVKRANDLGVTVDTFIHQNAGNTLTEREKLAEWLEARAYATEDQTVRKGFNKIAGVVKSMPREIEDRGFQVKLASTISKLDTQAGYVKEYGRRLPDPIATVFNTTKLAYESVTLVGKKIPLQQLVELGPDFFSDLLGADVLPEITSGGELDPALLKAVLPTLPVDLKKLVADRL